MRGLGLLSFVLNIPMSMQTRERANPVAVAVAVAVAVQLFIIYSLRAFRRARDGEARGRFAHSLTHSLDHSLARSVSQARDGGAGMVRTQGWWIK